MEKTIQEYLKNLSIESLMKLSSDSDSGIFDENSLIRQLVKEYQLSTTGEIFTGVIGLRNLILIEITRRYFGKLN